MGCSPKLSSRSCRNSKLSRVMGLLMLVLKNALMNMLVAENPVEAAADDEDDDDEVTSDDEVMAPSFCDASRNMSLVRSVYM